MTPCARCGRPATTKYVHRDDRRLALCDEHAAEHGPRIIKYEWKEI